MRVVITYYIYLLLWRNNWAKCIRVFRNNITKLTQCVVVTSDENMKIWPTFLITKLPPFNVFRNISTKAISLYQFDQIWPAKSFLVNRLVKFIYFVKIKLKSKNFVFCAVDAVWLQYRRVPWIARRSLQFILYIFDVFLY